MPVWLFLHFPLVKPKKDNQIYWIWISILYGVCIFYAEFIRVFQNHFLIFYSFSFMSTYGTNDNPF